MKQGVIKFSDERNKRFSIRTEIVSGKVYKYPIFPEGMAHLARMEQTREQLQKYYDVVTPCELTVHEDCVEFEFVKGESIERRYERAAKRMKPEEFQEILKYHYSLMIGNESNACNFESSEMFEKWFGDGSVYEGKAGLKTANFDAIPSNIIMRDGRPVFIDYEWVIDFCMPRDLVVYNCVNVLYLDNPAFEKFYPLENALKYLGVETSMDSLKNSYVNFFEHVISDEEGKSYAKDKITCLKNLDTITGIREEWSKCADFWRQAVEANANLDSELAEARRTNADLDGELADSRKANANLDIELEVARKTINDLSEYKKRYEEIVNSKGWRIASKLVKCSYDKEC